MSRTRNLEALPGTFSISLPADAEGWIGRECPKEGCERYFKAASGHRRKRELIAKALAAS